MIVFADHDGLFALLHFHGNQLFANTAGFVGGIGGLLAAQGVGVRIFARNAVLLG